MVNLLITGSIHTNDGKLIPVGIVAVMSKPDPTQLLEDLVVAAQYRRTELGNMRLKVTVKITPNCDPKEQRCSAYSPETRDFLHDIKNARNEGIPS